MRQYRPCRPKQQVKFAVIGNPRLGFTLLAEGQTGYQACISPEE
ncbi:hypothetical protein RHP47_06555 [Thermosynechococcus sp. QKsg1]|nr:MULTISPECIES: hypothetical protein [unclassified Thermosynechococcus]WNC66679.1 hypothetical protein RHK28_06595 [Thermosynechococcus sp. HY593]WNC87981.1 hypothetical protein RHP47_06555 [Thermosynechococcus sp. QKsg1]